MIFEIHLQYDSYTVIMKNMIFIVSTAESRLRKSTASNQKRGRFNHTLWFVLMKLDVEFYKGVVLLVAQSHLRLSTETQKKGG